MRKMSFGRFFLPLVLCIQMEGLKENKDKYAIVESYYILAQAYGHVPDLYVMWMLHLCEAHQEMRQWAEAAQCAVSVAGVVVRVSEGKDEWGKEHLDVPINFCTTFRAEAKANCVLDVPIISSHSMLFQGLPVTMRCGGRNTCMPCATSRAKFSVAMHVLLTCVPSFPVHLIPFQGLLASGHDAVWGEEHLDVLWRICPLARLQWRAKALSRTHRKNNFGATTVSVDAALKYLQVSGLLRALKPKTWRAASTVLRY